MRIFVERPYEDVHRMALEKSTRQMKTFTNKTREIVLGLVKAFNDKSFRLTRRYVNAESLGEAGHGVFFNTANLIRQRIEAASLRFR
jgi:hypothetical protein